MPLRLVKLLELVRRLALRRSVPVRAGRRAVRLLGLEDVEVGRFGLGRHGRLRSDAGLVLAERAGRSQVGAQAGRSQCGTDRPASGRLSQAERDLASTRRVVRFRNQRRFGRRDARR